MERDTKRGALLLRLFASMLAISACTFGGGFVIVSLMKKKFVDEYGWLSEEEMLDYTALAQSCPGAIAVNAAILTGWRVGGLAGMAAAVLGTVLPPLGILSVISLFYSAFAGNPYVTMLLSGMQAGVAAVLVDVVLSMGRGVLAQRSVLKNVVMAAAFAAVCFFDVNVMWVILGAGLLGAAVQLIYGREGRA
ncbi:MAG: chromate transporter [Christensenellales bacterium]|nr:chromate transporter [Christensenellales bacterium]